MIYCIQVGGGTPIYYQIVQRITHQVASGQLSKGSLVRSVRDVAMDLAINPMTVSKAYGILVERGILHRTKRNQLMVATGNLPVETRSELFKPYLDSLLEVAGDLGFRPRCVIGFIESSSCCWIDPPVS